MLTVTLQLKPIIVMFHLVGGLTIIALLWLLFLMNNQSNYFSNIKVLNNISFGKIKKNINFGLRDIKCFRNSDYAGWLD